MDITLDRRHTQDDAILRYKCLKWPLYTDTAIASGTRGEKAKKKSKVGTSVRGYHYFKSLRQNMVGSILVR